MAMVITFILIMTACGCLTGWILCDNFLEKKFWDRQNYMEKIDRKF